MPIQWIAAIVVSVVTTPRTWSGPSDQIHTHVWAAIFLGGAITILPVWLAVYRSGAASTRYVIAVGQMLMGGLLIHLTGGRIETHFHIFGSLAFLAFYRDWRVLVPATIVVVLDHGLRGVFLPESVYGVTAAADWRTLEHAGWVVFEDIFLVIACIRSRNDMWSKAVETVQRTAGEKRYRSLLAAISQVVWTANGDGRVTDTLPQWRALTGQTPEQVAGFGWLDAIHEDDRESTSQTWMEALRNRSPYHAEYRIRLATGEYGSYVSRGIPVLNHEGEVEEWVGICEDITPQKIAAAERGLLQERERQALVQVQTNERHYRQLADAMPQIVFTAMGDGWIDYFNQPWSTYTGRGTDQSLGFAWGNAIHPDDRERCIASWTEAVRQGGNFETEGRIRRASDGAFRWHIVRATAADNEDSTAVKWFGTCTDIDDQKCVEAELEHTLSQLENRVAERTAELVRVNDGLSVEIAERRLVEAERRVLFEIISGVTTTSDLQEFLELIHHSIGKVVYAENCFVALRDPATGMMGMEFFVDQFDEIPPPQMLGRSRTGYVFRTGEPILMTGDIAANLEHAGEIEPVGTPPASWLGIPLGTPGNPIGVLVVQHYEDPDAYSMRDLALMTSVGSQIAFAIERKQVEERLRESEEKYRTILHTLDDGYFEVDLQGNYVFLNEAFGRITGYRPAEMLGRSYREFFQEPLATELYDAYRQVYVTGTTLKMFEYEVTTPSGEKVFVEESVSLKRNADGKPIGFMGIRRDCSHRKLAEHELEEARNAALDSARLKSEFLANMSHEIRTPMNGVIGMTGLLLNTPLSPEQRDFTETIRSCGDSLLTIINDILDFSKIEAGKLEFEELDFDLGKLVESTVDVFAERARNQKLELASLVHSDVPLAVRGDPGRLRQVLTNLLGNALKFTREGEVVLYAEKEYESPEAVTVKFTVVDTGIGIPESARRHLFQAFTQADGSTTRKYGGTGLGLAISKQLVGLMNGQIGVRSRVGDGSQFWFTARFVKQIPSADSAIASTDASLNGLRVLIVDDNATNRTVLGHQLNSRGIEFVAAASGTDALELLKTDWRFDLALLDLMMPGMDGFELARQIKSKRRTAPIKLVLLTSFAAAEMEPSDNRDDIAVYLTKPVRQTHLFECLEELLAKGDKSRSRRKSVAGESFVAEIPAPVPIISEARILLAEDNLVNQKVATLQLQKLGYRADTVKNGHEALEALIRKHYDLVLMDCQMPVMDGYEATAAIRRREGDARRTPVIAMTANALEGDRDKCLAAGMDDYVSKPVNIDQLSKTIERFLAR
jgi:PAS domain S-box-containing protein